MSERGAEEAFDNLRGEVALLRRVIEGLLAEPSKASPEIARQLRSQAGELKRLADETERLAGQPVLALTPEALADQLRGMRRTVENELHAPWRVAIVDVERAGAELARCAGQVRTSEHQRRQVTIVALMSGSLTLASWLALSGPIARALPKQWQVAERLAAATLDESRWEAGRRLMGRADPASWREIEAARELIAQNGPALRRCARASLRPGAERRCTVNLPIRRG